MLYKNVQIFKDLSFIKILNVLYKRFIYLKLYNNIDLLIVIILRNINTFIFFVSSNSIVLWMAW